MAKIFITGITGFLGSNIARVLLSKGHNVIATHRSKSSKNTCADFENVVHWVSQDFQDWPTKVIEFAPEIIIHSAWIGVSHTERNNWEIQYENVDFLNTVLNIAKQSNARKFIGLGSQAEYGTYNGCIDENYTTAPTEAYGYIKIVCSELVKQFCNYNQIEWLWLRLFSFFGEGEANNWLIPSLVNKILTSHSMDFTAGEQKYAYLYVKDLGAAINIAIESDISASGIYNISSSKTIALRDLVQKITLLINHEFQLNFGKLPYRPNQSMHMQGNSDKFKTAFGNFEFSSFEDSLQQTIVHLVNQHRNNSPHESI